MKTIKFTKIHGAGNDFIIFDRTDLYGITLSREFISKICQRRFGIGADGAIILEKIDGFDFDMQYFNANGSVGSLCGNGARSAIWFAKLNGWIQNKAKFQNLGNVYTGEIIEKNNIRFYLNEPSHTRVGSLEVNDKNFEYFFIDTGSPHAIILFKKSIFEEPFDCIDMIKLGRAIRNHKDFEPFGTNVNFINMEDEIVKIRTYERGVEDETYACGTGTTAAALILHKYFQFSPPITIKTFKGVDLIVNFTLENKKITNLSLTGPADKVFTGELIFNEELNG